MTLDDLINRPRWHARAACRGATSLFFPDKGVGAREMRQIRAICSECPVRAECAAAGVSELHGVWGGTVVRDRRIARNPRNAAPVNSPAVEQRVGEAVRPVSPTTLEGGRP